MITTALIVVPGRRCCSQYTHAKVDRLMTTTPHVVLYGHHTTLHPTRRWLLERMGFEVSTASSVPALKRIYKQNNTRLLVICYTVKIEECGAVIALSQSTHPGLKIVLLSSPAHRNPSFNLLAAHISVESPARFSQSIQRLIDRAERVTKPVLLN